MSDAGNLRRAEVLAYLKENFEIEGDSAIELFDAFIESIRDNIASAEGNLAAGKWHDLNRNGHSIKGTAANVGANELSEAGKNLELAAKNQQTEICQAQVQCIKSILAEMQ